MGTEIYLKVGGARIDWVKNDRGIDHGVLFQDGDLTHVESDQTNYEYCAEHGIDTKTAERALSRTLKAVVPRLDLLGYTLEAVKSAYEAKYADWLEVKEVLHKANTSNESAATTFDEFIAFLHRHPLCTLNPSFPSTFDSERRSGVSEKFRADPTFDRIPNAYGADGYTEADYFGSLIDVLHPHAVLRLLALVPDNLNAEVLWHYGPMVDSGWADEAEFNPGARRHQRVLIVTEGSSDVHILKRAIELLIPEVQDFFGFIEVSERHPFSGTGSLVNFADGLKKIDVQNRILFVFDNDAEGWAAMEKVKALKLPSNMRTMVLPELEAFCAFPAFGPQGTTYGNINRRAAAIECYLDLTLPGRPPARVTWTNYKPESGVYQGSLDNKETYMRYFLNQKDTALQSGKYNTSKLRIVLEHIVRECQALGAIS